MQIAGGTPVAVALVACSLVAGCRKPALERRVDVATTVAEVRARHAPPEVVVEVVRQRNRPSGMAGCSSPVCLVLVPMLLADALFPDEWDEATVTERGQVTYLGRFSTRGEFLDARVVSGAATRVVARLDLKQLGRSVVVEVARVPGPVGGQQASQVRTPLLPQLPGLLEAYSAELGRRKKPAARADLLVEAATVLGAEADGWLEGRLADDAEPDEACAATLERLAPSGRVERLLAAVLRRPGGPGAQTSAWALSRLFKAGSPDPKAAGPFVEGLVRGLCVVDTREAARLAELLPPLRAAEGLASIAAEAAARCKQVDRRVAVLAALRRPQGRKDLEAALAKSLNPFTEIVVAQLDADEPESRAALLAILARWNGKGAARALAAGSAAPTAAEVPILARSYLEKGLLGAGGVVERRAALLSLLHRASETDRGPARELASAALAEHPDEASLQVALAVLGDSAHERAAARALRALSTLAKGWEDVGSEAQLVAYGLSLAGCSEEQIRQAPWKEGSGRVCGR